MKRFFFFFICLSTVTYATNASREGYFLIEDNVSAPTGQELGQWTVELVHWEPDTKASTIEEIANKIALRPGTSDLCMDSFKTTYLVNGNHLVIEDATGRIGSGTISGVGWDWMSMQFEVRSGDYRFEGTDYYKGEDILEKRVFKKEALVAKITGKERPITKTTYEWLLRKDLPSCSVIK